MNVYVMVDIEGISGIYNRDQVCEEHWQVSEGRRHLMGDINACVKGLKDAGVDKVYVHDCHGGGWMFDWEMASDLADGYVCGYVGDRRYANLEEFDAVILLGYHAMAGTQEAILEHTYSSKDVQNMYINGVKVGETAVDAAIAGEQGVPVIMVSGDDKVCAEAKAIMPDVVTAEVKKGLSRLGGTLLPPEKAHQLIYEKTIEAVKKADSIKPYVIPGPITCKMEMTEATRLFRPSVKPYMEILDGRTYTVTGDTVEQALWRAFW